MVPAKQILPMRDNAGTVYLVSPESLTLYRGLTGLTGDFIPDQSGLRAKTPQHTTDCANPIHDQQQPRYCACGQQIYQFAQLVRARDDICEQCRIKLGLPAPRLRPGLPDVLAQS
jgi:hypothetical protein